MDSNYLALVIDAAHARPAVRRQLRKLAALDKQVSAIADREKRKVARMSGAELMRRMESGSALGSDSKKRIVEINNRRSLLAEELASSIVSSRRDASELAVWICENREALISQLPPRKWWQALLGKD